MAVALHAGDANDLAGVNRQRDVFEREFGSGGRAGNRKVAHRKNDLGADGSFTSGRIGEIATHHEFGQTTTIDLTGRRGGDGGSLAHDGDLVAVAQHFVEFVRDEDDRAAFGDQSLECGEQFFDFLWHEHRGGFVENEYLRPAVEHLQDLHALPLAHAQRADQVVDVERHAQRRREFGETRLGRGRVDPSTAADWFVAEDDVLEDRQVVGQFEVLVHHPDTCGDGIGGGLERDSPAVDGDRSFVGLVHAVQRLHEGGLARTVLADDGVDGAGSNPQRHVVVGHHTREAFGDTGQFDCQCSRLVHATPGVVAPLRCAVNASVIAEPESREPGSMTRALWSFELLREKSEELVIVSDDQGAVGTSISPATILALISSSWPAMSSTYPPEVE